MSPARTFAMSEAELIAAHGGLPESRGPADLIDVREMGQRAVAAAILEAEARLMARMDEPRNRFRPAGAG